jgi:mono/diheme cytochrome c family protein
MIDSFYKFLAGLGYTDPLHAPFTHFPIGLVFGALVFFILALIFKKSKLILTARHASILAFVMVFPTILLGVLDWLHFWNGRLVNPIKYKIVLAAIVLLVLGVGIILGSEVKLFKWTTTIIYAIAFLAVVGLGWFGARLVPGTYAVIAAQAGQQGSQTAAAPSPGSGKAGESLFNDLCAACHPGGGNSIDASLPIKGSKKLASLQDFSAFIRNPKMPDGGEGSMPPFAKDQVSDAQAADLYQYIESMEQKGWK